jgi:hypothetical protein
MYVQMIYALDLFDIIDQQSFRKISKKRSEGKKKKKQTNIQNEN